MTQTFFSVKKTAQKNCVVRKCKKCVTWSRNGQRSLFSKIFYFFFLFHILTNSLQIFPLQLQPLLLLQNPFHKLLHQKLPIQQFIFLKGPFAEPYLCAKSCTALGFTVSNLSDFLTIRSHFYWGFQISNAHFFNKFVSGNAVFWSWKISKNFFSKIFKKIDFWPKNRFLA